MGMANNPSTDPKTYPTTAEVEAFEPLVIQRSFPVCVIRSTPYKTGGEVAAQRSFKAAVTLRQDNPAARLR